MEFGSTIGSRYALLSKAGAGASSDVYRARDVQTSQLVAVKVLKRTGAFDVARFSREAQVLASLHHPNVVEYVAHGESAGVHYLVQEWVDGVTLRSRMLGDGITARDAVAIVCEVARGLDAVHQLGVTHRDIKPSNIILVAGDPRRVKIVDFGTSRRAGDSVVLTSTGVVIGTPSYMAPEQGRGTKQIGPSSDIWALGCVLFESLTGRRAFSGNTAFATLSKVALDEPPPLDCPEAPAPLVALLAEMLAKLPERRPANGKAVLARLLALPAIGDGPRRHVDAPQALTEKLSTTILHAAASRSKPRAVVMFGAANTNDELDANQAATLDAVAARHGLELHAFEGGCAVLAAYEAGPAGALAAAHAALDLKQLLDCTVTLFGASAERGLNEAIDRAAVVQERATLAALFGELADQPAPLIQIDDQIATLITDQIPVVHTDRGPALAIPRTRTASR